MAGAPPLPAGGYSAYIRQLAGSLGVTESGAGQPWSLGERLYQKVQASNAFAAAGSIVLQSAFSALPIVLKPNEALLVEGVGGDITATAGAGGPVSVVGVQVAFIDLVTGLPILDFPTFFGGISLPAGVAAAIAGPAVSFYAQPPPPLRSRDLGLASGASLFLRVLATVTNAAGAVTVNLNAQSISRIISGVSP